MRVYVCKITTQSSLKLKDGKGTLGKDDRCLKVSCRSIQIGEWRLVGWEVDWSAEPDL